VHRKRAKKLKIADSARQLRGFPVVFAAAAPPYSLLRLAFFGFSRFFPPAFFRPLGVLRWRSLS
jgi:hypothetical protein